jgi:hypothetical protein
MAMRRRTASGLTGLGFPGCFARQASIAASISFGIRVLTYSAPRGGRPRGRLPDFLWVLLLALLALEIVVR